MTGECKGPGAKVLSFSSDKSIMKNMTFPEVPRHEGFTLIELVVVIIILGILAAIALPRFVNLQRDARIAKLEAARGSVMAAASLAHATVLARGGIADAAVCPADSAGPADNVATICTESGIVNLVNGYPATSAIGTAGILSMAGLTGVFNPSAAQLQTEGYTYAVTGTAARFGVVGATIAASCYFDYTQPASSGAAATISGVTTGGC